MAIDIEFEYYLQAFRLHQGLSEHGNRKTQALLSDAMAKAVGNGRVLPRAYGLQSFTILNAWLSDWITDDGKRSVTEKALSDVNDVEKVRALPGVVAEHLRKIDVGGSVDPIARGVVRAYASVAKEMDDQDFENLWSLATADLYFAQDYAAAFSGYQQARDLAQKNDVPMVSRSSLEVDYADALFFAGQPSLASGKDDYRRAIEEAIGIAEKAIKDNPDDPKRHRWNWTLGWAYHELGFYADPDNNYAKSLDILGRIRNPHHLIMKSLIASNVAAGNVGAAQELAKTFLGENPRYTLAVEDRWPYRNPDQREHWKEHLRGGGLPDPQASPRKAR